MAIQHNGTSPRKIFTITLEYDLGPHKTARTRLMDAFKEAVPAATAAVQGCLLHGSVETLTASMSYDYRFLTTFTEHVSDGNGDWDTIEHEDDGPVGMIEPVQERVTVDVD